MTKGLEELEKQYVASNDPQTLIRIHTTKQEINDILDKQVETQLKYLKQKYYEESKKSAGMEITQTTK